MRHLPAGFRLVVLLVATGCSASAGSASTVVGAVAGGCQPASPSDIASVRERLREPAPDVVDAYVVPVPAIEQVSDGFPDFILAARFISPTQDPVIGTWSLGEANNIKTVFPLDDESRLLTESAARSDSDIGKMLGQFSDSDSAVKARACVER